MRGMLWTLLLAGMVAPGWALPEVRLVDGKVEPAAVGEASVAWIVLENMGKEPVTVTRVATPLARVAAWSHVRKDGDGMVSRVPLDSIVLPPRRQVVVAPGGLELRFLDVVSPLDEGLDIPLMMTFGPEGEKTYRLRVERPLGQGR